MANAKLDQNRKPTLIGVDSTDLVTPVLVAVDPTTHRLLTSPSASASQISAHFQTDTFSSTNNQTTFTPSQTLVQDRGFYVNGSRQGPSTDYSIIGGAYVLNSGIPAGCTVVIDYIF